MNFTFILFFYLHDFIINTILINDLGIFKIIELYYWMKTSNHQSRIIKKDDIMKINSKTSTFPFELDEIDLNFDAKFLLSAASFYGTKIFKKNNK